MLKRQLLHQNFLVFSSGNQLHVGRADRVVVDVEGDHHRVF
jgi:hypothetical protein